MHFVDETDPRVRRSMVHRITLREGASYSPETDINVDKAFLNLWNGR